MIHKPAEAYDRPHNLVGEVSKVDKVVGVTRIGEKMKAYRGGLGGLPEVLSSHGRPRDAHCARSPRL